MFNTPYMNYNQGFNQQTLSERIDTQIAQLNQMKEQMKNNNQQPAINQTFQISPTSNHAMKFVNTIDDVEKEIVYFDTPFFSSDMSVMWIKNIKGNIRTYELSEIIPKDSKDMQIEFLQQQIEELKGKIENERNVTDVNAEQNATDTEKNDDTIGTTTKNVKSANVQKISRSKGK